MLLLFALQEQGGKARASSRTPNKREKSGAGDNISLMGPNEAEKRPGTPTDYYLIADTGNQRVIEVQAQGTNGGTIVWQYGQTGIVGSGTNQLRYPIDAMRLICGTILIVDRGNNRVIEVQPTGTSGGTIVWECSASTGLPLTAPFEAIRISNWKMSSNTKAWQEIGSSRLKR